MSRPVLTIDMIGKTIKHNEGIVLICEHDLPVDKVVLFLSQYEYEKIILQFDVSVKE